MCGRRRRAAGGDRSTTSSTSQAILRDLPLRRLLKDGRFYVQPAQQALFDLVSDCGYGNISWRRLGRQVWIQSAKGEGPTAMRTLGETDHFSHIQR
jgi:hypothetical protein